MLLLTTCVIPVTLQVIRYYAIQNEKPIIYSHPIFFFFLNIAHCRCNTSLCKTEKNNSYLLERFYLEIKGDGIFYTYLPSYPLYLKPASI